MKKRGKKVNKKANSHFNNGYSLRITPSSKRSNSRLNFEFHKCLPKSKRSQHTMGLPFSTIFSVILIIAFIAVAFFVINAFLDSKRCAQVGVFVNNLERDVKKAWNSAGIDFEFPGSLPKNMKKVCFIDFTKTLRGPHRNDDIGLTVDNFRGYRCKGGEPCNLILYPTQAACDMEYHLIEHLDTAQITINENPYCIDVTKGEVEFRIIKELNQRLVEIKRVR